MQKNWYIIYTKPKCEKKVAVSFTKKNIENFCPLNCIKIQSFRRSKTLQELLFKSYVFVYIEESDISLLKQVESVVSLVYWKGRPAIIKDKEIEAIKEFITDYRDIKLEKTKVNVNGEARIVDGPSYTMDGKILMIKNRSFNVNLPSLGFTMIAEMEAESMRGKEILFGNKELLLQS
ncbi:MAG TPA: transcription termination/antitermination NusG family protein [Ginsengibacter sp.]